MTRQEIFEKCVKIFGMLTNAENIQESDELVDNLGISSMDLLMLLTCVEEEFHITLTERSVRRVLTVKDLVDLIANKMP